MRFQAKRKIVYLSLFLGATYCPCRDGVGEKDLQTSIDYACGVLGDCNPIHEKGPFYQPNNVESHCDWAVNSYFQRSGQLLLEISLKITWSLSYPNEFRIKGKRKYVFLMSLGNIISI